MNLIKNKKKDVKQFLQEMKANKTIRSSNNNSINNSISSQLKSSPISLHQQEKINSNGISQRIRYDNIDSRKGPNLDTVRGYTSPNHSNISQYSQNQRNIPFTNVNTMNRLSQNPNQQQSIYYPPDRSFYHEPYGPPHQSSPIYFPHQNNYPITSQNLQRSYSASQNSQPFYSNNQFLDDPYISKVYQKNNRQQYIPQNNVNLVKNSSFFRDSGVSYNSQKSQNYNIQPKKQHIHKNIIKNSNNYPKQTGSYYSQKIQINNHPYETKNLSRPQPNITQLSYSNYLQMQQIRQTSVDQSSSDKNTPGKISNFSQISMKKEIIIIVRQVKFKNQKILRKIIFLMKNNRVSKMLKIWKIKLKRIVNNQQKQRKTILKFPNKIKLK